MKLYQDPPRFGCLETLTEAPGQEGAGMFQGFPAESVETAVETADETKP